VGSLTRHSSREADEQCRATGGGAGGAKGGDQEERKRAEHTPNTGRGFCLIGTPSEIVDVMQDWFENDACDGFNITPTHLPGGCEDFVEMITPELQRRGLFRKEYEGKTLRENLGLKPAVSRYASKTKAAGADSTIRTK